MNTPELVSIVAALLAVAALALAAFALQRARALTQRVVELETSARRSAEFMEGFSEGAVGQGELIARVEQDLARLRSRLDQLASTSDGSGAAFNQAIRMARKGCSADEIMETCGLSKIEADLVVLLHRSEQ